MTLGLALLCVGAWAVCSIGLGALVNWWLVQGHDTDSTDDDRLW